MAQDINKRLSRLRARRGGIDRMEMMSNEARVAAAQKFIPEEKWETRAQNKPFTRYALGAMQEVDTDYTRISLETAERVGNQLRMGLAAAGHSVEFRIQGSVALNVHIRGVSDVDLLTLSTDFFTYATTGQRSLLGYYRTPTQQTSLGVLKAIRSESETILRNKFPAATVDTSGGKAIAIFGGSLPRPVDVVPSHWHDTSSYQSSGNSWERGVTIFNKKVPETIDNLPFLHIYRIDERNKLAREGLKKAIRLCKNLKNDAIEEGESIDFPSFDIAATMYHADVGALQNGYFYELSILAETQRFLDELYHKPDKAKSLYVPDGSRRIFDTEQKYSGLKTLSVEMDNLTREVAKEQARMLGSLTEISLWDARSSLSQAYIP